MANIKISELNEITKSQTAYNDYLPIVDTSANETKKISVESLTANNVYLLAVVKPNEQVPAPVAGSKIYIEVRNKIYYALDDERWQEYGTPVEGIFYIVLGEKGNYAYDSENETLVSVGGGSGSEIVIGDEEPTEDTKMIIDTDAFDPQYSDITDEYSEASNMAYNCDYSNKAFGGKLLWTNTSPTSQFGEQKINVELTDYNFYEVLYKTATGDNNIQTSGKIPKGYGTILSYGIGNASNGPYNEFRSITASSDSGITFSLGIEAFASTRNVDNTKCIPLYIIGYKIGLFS